MRLLRQKHGISTIELSQHTGLSQQRISELELSGNEVTTHTSGLILSGFRAAADARKRACDCLQDDLQKYGGRLMNVTKGDEGL